MKFQNKIVWVTGASSDIGLSIAYEFAKEGATLVLHYYQNKDNIMILKDQIEKSWNTKTLIVQGDISKEEDVKRMTTEVMVQFGHIDILVNNAAMAQDEDFFEKDIQTVKRVMDVNAIGTYMMCKEVGSILKQQGYGNIINIASTNGIDTPYPESADYDMSKAAIISLTHNMATLLSPNCRVNAVAPGWVYTQTTRDMNPSFKTNQEQHILLNRFAVPEEIAHVVVFLASDEASYINSTVIRVDGGIKC